MKLRILHLEDSADDAALISMSLSRGGLDCDIVHVSSGQAYLSALEQPAFDLILSDGGVPGFDGNAALARAADRCPQVPFIVVSGFTPSESADFSQHAGRTVRRIAKSSLDQLVPAIRSALQASAAALPARDETAAYVAGMQQLVAVVQQLSMARNIQSVMDIVRRAARSLVAADGAAFVLRDGDKCFYAEEDAIGPLWKGKRFPLSACISGWAMLNRQAAVIEDIYQDSRIPHDAYRPTFVKSLVMTPIRTVAPIGAIGVYWARTRLATARETELLQALADSTSVAIESVDLLANLERRVAERTGELHRRSTELEVLNRELEAFSYSVAHDLRAPLISIDGFSQGLLRSHAERLDGTGREHLERICGGVARMQQLIKDLLELAKIVRAPLHPTSVDLSQTAREIVAALSEASPARSVHVSIESDMVAQGDAGLLRIVLENLLSNAWKYTSKKSSARIELGSQTDSEGRRTYSIRDNGAGFDPRHAANLFGPFQRLHSEAQFPGTGIGLATVQRIVHRHGGEIWAEASIDQGACFSFTLPKA